MAPRTAKQYNDIRQQKRRLIMETALELFAQGGFHSTSISQIAKKAGISKGLTYNYFESKNDILTEILESCSNEIYSNFDLNKDGILNDEEFYYFIRKTFQLIHENQRFWKLYTSVILQTNILEEENETLGNKIKPVQSILLEYIVSKGSSDPEGDLIVITTLLKGVAISIISSEFFPYKPLEEKIIKAITLILNHE